MKALFFSIIILLLGNFSFARCPLNTKCFPFSRAEGAVATPEQAESLRDAVMLLGTEGVLRNCKPGKDTKVTEVFGELCAPGSAAGRVCNYETNLDCTLDGKSFDMKVNGGCKGGLHDCGTFQSCALQQGVNIKDGSFRSAGAAVPKSSNFTPNGGTR